MVKLAAAALLLLSGCQWAIVRYHEGAEDSLMLRCQPARDQPNALECWDYFKGFGPVQETSFRYTGSRSPPSRHP